MIKSLFGEDENTEKKEDKPPDNKGGLGILSDEKTVDDSEKKVSTPDFETEKDVKQVERIETVDEIKAAIENPQEFRKEESKTESPNNQTFNTIKPFEVDHPIGKPQIDKKIENNQSSIERQPVFEEPHESSRTIELENKLREIEEELKREKELEEERRRKKKEEELHQKALQEAKVKQSQPHDETETIVKPKQDNQQQPLWDNWDKDVKEKQEKNDDKIQITQKGFDPNEQAKNIRNVGMAWSAAIALFGAVVIMLVMGWFADLLLGSSPWGIVVGIVIGAIIGFLQFFRTTSQIVNPKPSDFDKVSLTTNIKVAEETKDKDKEALELEEKSEEKYDEKGVDNNEVSPIEKTDSNNEEIKPEQTAPESTENAESSGEDILEIEEKTTDKQSF